MFPTLRPIRLLQQRSKIATFTPPDRTRRAGEARANAMRGRGAALHRISRLRRLLFAALIGAFVAVPAAGDETAAARRHMVEVIREIAAYHGPVRGASTIDARVLAAMELIPRHLFVPDRQSPYAYDDRPLPIGYGQTISQPYIVALMSDLLDLDDAPAVLEVGTGSGYQAAVLGQMGARVFTIEIVPELARAAAERLLRLGFAGVTVRQGDGYYGWQEHAPFDAIIVTAAASHIPPPLVRQLKPGGRMIIPVGNPFFTQQLLLVEKAADGAVATRQLLPVRFVPLTGKH